MQETAAHKHWRWFFTLFLTVTGILACIFVLPRAIVFFFPFVIGWLIALMASPLARWLEKKLHIRKKVGSVIVVVLVLAVITIGMYFLISRLIREVVDFIPQAPAYLQKLLDLLSKLEDWLGGIFKGLPENVREAFDSFSQDVRDTLIFAVRDFSANFATTVGNAALSVPTALFYTVITIVCSFLLIWERERLWNGFYSRMPESVRNFIDMGKQSLKKALSGYFVAQLKMSWIVAIIVLVGLLLLKIPYALLLSLLIAFIDFLPIFGSGTVLWPWALAEVTQGRYMMALWLMVIYLAVQVARNILSPKFMGQTMGLSGLMTIFSMLVGFRLYGVIGLVFAIPVGMLVVEVCQYGVFKPAIGVLKEMAATIGGYLKKPEAEPEIRPEEMLPQEEIPAAEGKETVPAEEETTQ
ncbi:MAG: sporulation integral membrane protein YtvI [Lachnospiraceae bacterium]|nr:sporulation integral membrane protein YtvI [Lachnospiraceae bacterium]